MWGWQHANWWRVGARARTHAPTHARSAAQALNQWLNVQLSILGSLMILGCCCFGVAGRHVLGSALAIMAIQTSTSVSPVLASLLTNWAVAEQVRACVRASEREWLGLVIYLQSVCLLVC